MITIPTLKEIYDDAISSLETNLGINIPTFGKNIFRPLAAVQAAKLKLYYLLLAKVQKNIFVDTADPVAQGGTLERFGEVKLGRPPNPAVAGQYTSTVTGTVSAVIPAQTTFKSDDTSSAPGYLYILDIAYTMTSTSESITLRALTAGAVSKLSISDTLTATAPISNVDSFATVTAVFVESLESEGIEVYRQRIIEAYRAEPQGGAAVDYRLWASDAQGVKNSYPYAKAGQDGIIDLYVEATTTDSSDGKGTPTSGILTAVEDVVELDPDTTLPMNERGRKPLGVYQVNYLPISIIDITIQITGGSYTTDQETSIKSALVEAVNLVRPFITGADVVADKNNILDNNKTVFVIQSTVPSVAFTGISITFNSVSLTTYLFNNGEIPNLASANITYA